MGKNEMKYVCLVLELHRIRVKVTVVVPAAVDVVYLEMFGESRALHTISHWSIKNSHS